MDRLPIVVNLLKGEDAPRWDDFVRRGPQATFFHLSAWRDLMEEVFDSSGREVGPWLRVKNNYRAEFDAVDSYGYRALIGNLKHSSGMVCSELFAGDPET
ncbi:MAG: hypothetical protein QMC09_18360, partial [Thauera sp.]